MKVRNGFTGEWYEAFDHNDMIDCYHCGMDRPDNDMDCPQCDMPAICEGEPGAEMLAEYNLIKERHLAMIERNRS